MKITAIENDAIHGRWFVEVDVDGEARHVIVPRQPVLAWLQALRDTSKIGAPMALTGVVANDDGPEIPPEKRMEIVQLVAAHPSLPLPR